ncbi:hypothetical protein [Streptomyces koyangensis]|uniref:Uncharacterized protein n=1 Tax=Streptomyces koyangensis TaxID=188770 RepID=A0A385DKR8_9ACTN|nr:hypothetical protein [Streptomyces koyangensis]AXQ58560.1 hypothetical protein D0C37_30775 [Streptomyces koyangensis]
MRSTWFVHGSAVAAAVLLGVSGPLLMTAQAWPVQAAHLVLSAGWSWAALAFGLGTRARSLAGSARLGTCAPVIAVFAYYLVKAAQGQFATMDMSDPADPAAATYFSWHGFLSATLLWSLYACLLGPLLGMAGYAARRGPCRTPYLWVVPAVAVAETTLRLGAEAAWADPVVVATWTTVRVLAVLAVAAATARPFVLRLRRLPAAARDHRDTPARPTPPTPEDR